MVRRIISLYAKHKRHVAFILLLTTLSSGLSMVAPYFTGKITDGVIRKEKLSVLLFFVLTGFVFEALNRSIRTLRQQFDLRCVWFPIQEALRFETFGNYLGFSIGQLKQTSVGLSREILNNGEAAMMRMAQLVVQRFLPLVMQFLVVTVLLYWRQPKLACVVTLGLSIYAFCQWMVQKDYTRLIEERRDKNLASSKMRGEMLMAAVLVKTYVKETFALERYREEYLISAEVSKRVNWYIAKRDTLISFVVTLTQATAFALGLFMVTRGEISFGYLIMVSYWWSQMCSVIGVIGEEYQNILDYMSDIRKFFELIDTPPRVQEIPDPIRLRNLVGFIRFQNVCYSYPAREQSEEARKKGKKKRLPKQVIHDVSFTIRAGERVAIVGPTGSGKSTLVMLLQRGDDVDSGVIEVDGVNLRSLAKDDFYRNVGVVDQGALTVSLSIRENIKLGAHGPLSDEEIIMFCRMAELDVEVFEDGLDTVIGEMGNGVSGGERQRIAIARALASNPKILIFDEPTSSLDAMTEAKIKRTIEIASRGRTSITIAHRLSTIQHSDRIIVMENGRVAAIGTHQELLMSSGTYLAFAHEQKILV